MVYSAKSDATGTISQFTRRKDIKITTGGTSTPANYQVKVTVAYAPEMQTSFQDIRFNTKNQVYIDYWIESFTASTTATVWIELPDAITDPGSDSIWMYYGNPSAASASNGITTFIKFNDGFLGDGWVSSGASIVDGMIRIAAGTNNYFSSSDTIPNNVVLEYSMNDSQTLANLAEMLGFVSTNTDFVVGTSRGVFFQHSGPTPDEYTEYANPTENPVRIRTPDLTLTKMKIIWTDSGTTTKFYVNNTQYTSPSLGFPSDTSLYLYFGGINTNDQVAFSVDNIIVRKYIANEPTATLGTAQHQRRIPTFL